MSTHLLCTRTLCIHIAVHVHVTLSLLLLHVPSFIFLLYLILYLKLCLFYSYSYHILRAASYMHVLRMHAHFYLLSLPPSLLTISVLLIDKDILILISITASQKNVPTYTYTCKSCWRTMLSCQTVLTVVNCDVICVSLYSMYSDVMV